VFRGRTAFLLLLVLSTKWTDGGGITIRPSGPAAGFVEDTSFNLTCFSSRPGNVTWALPVHSSDELDNIQIKVHQTDCILLHSILIPRNILFLVLFCLTKDATGFTETCPSDDFTRRRCFCSRSERRESQEIRFGTLHLSPRWRRSSRLEGSI
jgi:hypothetical protein